MLTDIIVGIIAGLIMMGFSDLGPLVIVFSIIYSFMPDLDFLIYHARNPINRFSHRHRRLLHLPLLYIALCLILLKTFDAPGELYFLFLALSLIHFIHDTFSIGYGVQWLYPFSSRQYFFGQKTPTSRKLFAKIYSDTPKNIDAHAEKFGDDKWLRGAIWYN